MGAILHLPQGGAQIVVTSEIPEVYIPGQDSTVEEVQTTLGEYTYHVGTNGTAILLNDHYSTQYYPQWQLDDPVNHGDSLPINGAKHYGINLYPTQDRERYEFIFIDRILNMASKRLIIIEKISEADWTNSTIHTYLIPFDLNKTRDDYIQQLHNHINGQTDSTIIEYTLNHSGQLNDEDSIILGELPSAGRYYAAVRATANIDNAGTTIYRLNFRTY